MSLNFQLVRGGLALALLFALSVTAWLAPAAQGTTRVIILNDVAAVATVCPVPPPVLRLALSPADLPASHRANGSCRA
jgi:hypothetical protein